VLTYCTIDSNDMSLGARGSRGSRARARAIGVGRVNDPVVHATGLSVVPAGVDLGREGGTWHRRQRPKEKV
jgi:hypothetical protein